MQGDGLRRVDGRSGGTAQPVGGVPLPYWYTLAV